MKEVTIYTDGACSGNPGPGGWGAILMYEDIKKEISGGNPETTNNIMEIRRFYKTREKAIMERARNKSVNRTVEQQKDNYNIRTLEEYNENPLPIHKVCFVALNRESLDVIKEKLSYKYHIIIHELFSNDVINGEFIIKGTNKGNAVRQVAEFYNMSTDDTIAFGDSMNDYEMIRAVKYGVVMGNGSAKLKEYASSICEHIDDDGVYHELKRLNII